MHRFDGRVVITDLLFVFAEESVQDAARTRAAKAWVMRLLVNLCLLMGLLLLVWLVSLERLLLVSGLLLVARFLLGDALPT